MSATSVPGSTRETYRSRGGVDICRNIDEVPMEGALEGVLEKINTHRGAVFASGYEYPGRYSRWDIASSILPWRLPHASAPLRSGH